MKKENLKGLIIIILVIVIVVWNIIDPFFILVQPKYVIMDDESLISCVEEEYQEEESNYLTVTVTKYNPVPEQCDLDPFITADGSFIDTLQLRKGNLRWIAISRDLREYFNYGDTVIIESNDDKINGEYVVRDTMNPRWTYRVDLLSPCGDSLGKWDNVYIYKK